MKTRILLSIFLVSQLAISQTYNWTQQTSGVAQTLNDVFFVNSQTGWVVGVSGIVLNTSNGGVQWTSQTSGTTQNLETVCFISDSVGWIGGGTSNAMLLKTTNGGQTWNAVTGINIPSPIIDIAFADVSTGWLITSDSIYYSNNGGLSWVAEGYTGVIGTAVNHSLVAVSSTQAFVGGRRFQTGIQDSSPEVYDRRMTGGSYTWGPTTTNQFDLNDRIESIAFSGSSYGIAGGINGKLYRMEVVASVVTGPWEEVLDLGGGNNQIINSIVFPSANRGLFCTPSQSGSNSYTLIYHTNDTGENWSGPDSIPNFLANKMHAPDTMTAWSVGGNGKIYKGVDPTIEIQDVDQESEWRVYPNPFTNTLVIEPKNSHSIVGVEMINVFGQLVWREKIENINSAVELNCSFLPNGIYYLRMTDGHNNQWVEKILKN